MKYNQQAYGETDYRAIKIAAAMDGLDVRNWIKLTAVRTANAKLQQGPVPSGNDGGGTENTESGVIE